MLVCVCVLCVYVLVDGGVLFSGTPKSEIEIIHDTHNTHYRTALFPNAILVWHHDKAKLTNMPRGVPFRFLNF